MSMKNSKDVIGNRTRDLLACSAVPQPTAPLHANNTRPLFCFADIVCHFLLLFYSECGWLCRWATINDAIGSDKRTILLRHSKDPIYEINVGQDSSVGTATRYGLDGPAIESR